ncbi:sugar transferase [Macrococcus brunensis]|uniref:sugar transferase n=1 Tax=Macrococcus brunensis TaxID=198483 RepID=UPI001EF0B513|nr:sugar transferase [Macrococcus brunensis]ULG72702.1 sugar transferase [Macrococcus brunensis]
MKRIFDFTAATVGIIVLSPIIISTAVIVKKNIGTPVLFTQVRPGKDGKPFKLYKFRTMTNDRGLDGELLPDEARMTTTGNILRKYSLDELPQLINVIKGNLSLVGPRPLLMEYNDLYNEHQRRRLEVKPGITGWAQINGRNSISWEQKFDLDVWYVENKSFVLDIYILLKTIEKVFKSEGINQEGQVTISKFEGSRTT